MSINCFSGKGHREYHDKCILEADDIGCRRLERRNLQLRDSRNGINTFRKFFDFMFALIKEFINMYVMCRPLQTH